MKLQQLHPWDVTPQEAVTIQERLRPLVSTVWDGRPIERVAGVDVGLNRAGDAAHASIVVLSFPELLLLEEHTAAAPVAFPYVPGLLSFREVPVVAAVLDRVQQEPSVVLVDGQGIAHPRRLGIAAHLGLLLDLPTIGCAKSRLVGSFDQPADKPCVWTPLLHRREQVGAVLRTKAGTNPLFVSIGHRISLDKAIEVVCACGKGYRLPEPTRLAHLAASAYRRMT